MPLSGRLILVLALGLTPLSADGGSTSEESSPPESAASGPTVEERVEVRARPTDSDEVAAFSTRLEADELRARGQDLADLLRRVPGARVRDYGGLGSFATVSLRASTAEQVTILVDGIPQNRALGGPVDLSSIPATQLDNVTVFRGSGPASYGLGGIGGIVDIRTQSPTDKATVQLDAVIGELATRRLSGSLSLPTGQSSAFRIGVESLESDGDFLFLDTGATLFDLSDDRLRHRENNGLENRSAVVRQIWDRVGGGRMTLGVRLQDRRRGVPGLDSFPSQSANLEEQLLDASTSWSRAGDGTVESIDLSAQIFDEAVRFHDPLGDLGLVRDQSTDVSGAGLVGMVRLRAGAHRPLARGELRLERADSTDAAVEASDRGGVERRRVSITAEDVITVGRTVLAPSLLWQSWRDDFRSGSAGTLPPPADDSQDQAWSGKLGVAHALGNGWAVRGTAGHFHRIPNLSELFGNRGTVLGNPALRPESGTTIEAGFSWDRNGPSPLKHLELVGYARDVDDLIVLQLVGPGAVRPSNLDGAQIRGVEAVAGMRWRFGLAIDGSLTFERAIDARTGLRLPFQAAGTGYLGLGFRRAGFGVRWDFTYIGYDFAGPANLPESRINERYLHDLFLSYEVPSSGVQLGIDVRNVFDRFVRDVARYPLPGRVISFHVGWRSSEKGS